MQNVSSFRTFCYHFYSSYSVEKLSRICAIKIIHQSMLIDVAQWTVKWNLGQSLVFSSFCNVTAISKDNWHLNMSLNGTSSLAHWFFSINTCNTTTWSRVGWICKYGTADNRQKADCKVIYGFSTIRVSTLTLRFFTSQLNISFTELVQIQWNDYTNYMYADDISRW